MLLFILFGRCCGIEKGLCELVVVGDGFTVTGSIYWWAGLLVCVWCVVGGGLVVVVFWVWGSWVGCGCCFVVLVGVLFSWGGGVNMWFEKKGEGFVWGLGDT